MASTPGPWKLGKPAGQAPAWENVVGPQDQPVCHVEQVAQGQDNAKLIAAAPDLLAACKSALALVIAAPVTGGSAYAIHQFRVEVTAVIARAGG